MCRGKSVKLSLTEGKGTFFVEGTEPVRDIPFNSGQLRIQGEGFTITLLLMKSPNSLARFNVDAIIEYNEDIQETK